MKADKTSRTYRINERETLKYGHGHVIWLLLTDLNNQKQLGKRSLGFLLWAVISLET